ncbi:MAG: hypothetical protein ACLR8Y_22060 [Alistipes indistinctus]
MCTAASAQTGFGWGVKGGLNITGMTNSEEGQSKTGFVVGAFADYRFTPKVPRFRWTHSIHARA